MDVAAKSNTVQGAGCVPYFETYHKFKRISIEHKVAGRDLTTLVTLVCGFFE